MKHALGGLGDHRALRLGVLRGLSGYLESLTDAAGVLRCPRHRVEHTGKNVYGAVINQIYWRYSREDEYLERARRQVLRAVDSLGEDPDSRVPVFLPGRVDPRNASTNSIDGGACADAIATLLELEPDAFDAGETERCRAALERHVEGYLRHSARDRPITAQRLWAATGVARAARLLGRDDWRADALAGCALALRELHEDGVAPYIPLDSRDCSHPGLADVSGFYHSRTPGFVLYVHEVLEEPLDDGTRDALRRALDALCAMRGGLGHKVVVNEAKPWYWESAYEVASHAFDVYALQRGAERLEEPAYAAEAARAMEEWIAHIAPDGGVLSHHGRGVNFQCRVFWTAHGAWAARVIDTVGVRAAARRPRDVDLRVSGLLHVERERYVAVLRGHKRPHGNLFGCSVGGGQMQSLVVLGGPGEMPEERVRSGRHRQDVEGSFRVLPVRRAGPLARVRARLAADRSDLRFRLYVATVEWAAREWWHALGYPLRHVVSRVLRDATAWRAAHLDGETRHRYDGRAAVFEGGVADVDGVRLDGVRTRREYGFEPDRVTLLDRLEIDGGVARVRYRLPSGAVLERVDASGGSLRRSGRLVELRVDGDGPARLELALAWSAAVSAAAARPRGR